LGCYSDYFGTNCLVPRYNNQIIFPIVNCVEQDSSNNTYIYLGYANTQEYSLYSNNSIGDDTFKCGNNTVDINISYFIYGQYNFQSIVQCNENIVWSINGSVLTLSQNDLLSRLCSNTLYQKFLLTVSQTPSFTDSQLYN